MILLTMENTQEYLKREMDLRGWSQADLARYSKLDPSLINNYLTGRRNIGISAAVSIAEAFNCPPENVLRAIGLLPDLPKRTKDSKSLLHLFDQMTNQEQADLIFYAEFLLSKR